MPTIRLQVLSSIPLPALDLAYHFYQETHLPFCLFGSSCKHAGCLFAPSPFGVEQSSFGSGLLCAGHKDMGPHDGAPSSAYALGTVGNSASALFP